jgi:ABC-2 type transport system ATP-binding protein
MILETRDLVVRHGGTVAVGGVSLEVPEGSVYALLGRNGAGKSSLVRCLLGQHPAARGAVRLFGRDPWRERAALMADVGVVPETPDAPPAMTALALLRFDARLYRRHDLAAALVRLERFGVPADRPFGSLSKGQRAQVALALALAHSPTLLVLDDPTLGLDPVARRALYDELIGDLADRGTTVFLTSHDLDGVERIADRVGVLRSGKLVVQDELESLKRTFRSAHPGSADAPLGLEEIFVSLAGAAQEGGGSR